MKDGEERDRVMRAKFLVLTKSPNDSEYLFFFFFFCTSVVQFVFLSAPSQESKPWVFTHGCHLGNVSYLS